MRQYRKESRYRTHLEMGPGALYRLSAGDGAITSLDRGFERITGWSEAEMLGKPFTSLIHPDDLKLARTGHQKVLRGEAPPSCELRILTKSGEYRVGEFIRVPHLEKGKVIGELGMARDVTEIKRAGKRLFSTPYRGRQG